MNLGNIIKEQRQELEKIEREEKVKGKRIRYIPLWKWLLETKTNS